MPPQVHFSHSGQRSETERRRQLGEAFGNQFSQTHEDDRAVNDGPHARKRRLTSSEERQKPDGNSQCPAHPSTPPIHPTHCRGVLDIGVNRGSRTLVARISIAPNRLEAFNRLFDFGECRRDVCCGEVGQQAEGATTWGTMPSRYPQPGRLDAVVIADLAQTAAASGMQRALLETGIPPRLLSNVVLAGELCLKSKLHQHEARVPRQERRASTLSFLGTMPASLSPTLVRRVGKKVPPPSRFGSGTATTSRKSRTRNQAR